MAPFDRLNVADVGDVDAPSVSPLALVQFDSHINTWDEYFGSKYYHGTPFRRAIEEGLVDGKRFVQIGIRGSMYGEDDFAFHRTSVSP